MAALLDTGIEECFCISCAHIILTTGTRAPDRGTALVQEWQWI